MSFESNLTQRAKRVSFAWQVWFAVLLISLAFAMVAKADIAPAQVLVVYNAQSAEAIMLKDAYLAAHPGIPAGSNVLALDDASLLTADLSYADFVTKVRTPIRDHIEAVGYPEPADILSIVLVRPFPHRVQDTTAPTSGDNPSQTVTQFNNGDATCASVDAELVLLWQDLDSGESGGTMDSYSDNVIDNPYHTLSAPFDSFTRSGILLPKVLVNYGNVAWQLGSPGKAQLTPADMVLVCRLDGHTLEDAEALIDRAQGLYINKAFGRIILDEYDQTIGAGLDNQGFGPFPAYQDYENARDSLMASGWDVLYDSTTDFITSAEETNPIIAYASYGENHSQSGAGENPPGSGTYIEGFRFPPGAMFNTIESYNGRALNGLGTLFNQEQVADFIAEGGTFAIGHVWEPFAFSLPDNEFLFVNMLGGQMCWAEAAYSSIPALSWHHVVLGDPLAVPTIIDDLGLPMGDLDGDGSADGEDIVQFMQILLDGVAAYRTDFPALDPVARADFTGDLFVTLDDLPDFVSALLGS